MCCFFASLVDSIVAGTAADLLPDRALLCCRPCTLQEEFKSVVKDHQGFEYRAERPNGTNFVQQKFGWTGLQLGEACASHQQLCANTTVATVPAGGVPATVAC
jgi:hypothetical protein